MSKKDPSFGVMSKPTGLGVLDDYDKIRIGLQGITDALKNKDRKVAIDDARINTRDVGALLTNAMKDAELLHGILTTRVLPLVLKGKRKKSKRKGK